MCRFSPAVMAPHLAAVSEIALADSASDNVPLRQVAAGLIGTLLVEITVSWSQGSIEGVDGEGLD